LCCCVTYRPLSIAELTRPYYIVILLRFTIIIIIIIIIIIEESRYPGIGSKFLFSPTQPTNKIQPLTLRESTCAARVRTWKSVANTHRHDVSDVRTRTRCGFRIAQWNRLCPDSQRSRIRLNEKIENRKHGFRFEGEKKSTRGATFLNVLLYFHLPLFQYRRFDTA